MSSNNSQQLKPQQLAELEVSMRQALANLDASIRREYDQAVQEMPALVAEESPWLDFLQVVDYAPAQAAEKLALYWKYRRDLFGSDRWLLRLNQTGTGALTFDDIALLRTGFWVNVVQAEHGSVAIVDMSRIERADPRTEARLT